MTANLLKQNLLTALKDIPKSASVCIYGCGQAGISLLKKLGKKRKDIHVLCFLDTYRKGECCGLEIKKAEELDSFKNQVDWILIASVHHKEIEKKLQNMGFGNYLVTADRLVKNPKKRKISPFKKWFRQYPWKPISQLLYLMTVFFLYPLNLILVLAKKNKYQAGSVLHISYMVHIPYYTVAILRELGIQTDFMAIGSSPLWYKCDYQVVYSANPVKKAFQEFRWFWKVVSRYEIIHSHFGIMLSEMEWELPLLKRLGRKIVIHFRGCDIRDKYTNLAINPEYKICDECDYHEVCLGKTFRRRRKLAKKYGRLFLVTTPDMRGFMPEALHLPFFIMENPDIQAASSGKDGKAEIKIVHVTVHPGIEGTNRIRQVIERLKQQGYPLEFVFLRNVPHDRILKELASADISIGKMKMGYYANAQIESMMLGVPAITYVRPEFMTPELKSSGFIFTTLDELEKTLRYYLDHPEALQAKKARARESILQLHDNHKIARSLIDHYRRLGQGTTRNDTHTK